MLATWNSEDALALYKKGIRGPARIAYAFFKSPKHVLADGTPVAPRGLAASRDIANAFLLFPDVSIAIEEGTYRVRNLELEAQLEELRKSRNDRYKKKLEDQGAPGGKATVVSTSSTRMDDTDELVPAGTPFTLVLQPNADGDPTPVFTMASVDDTLPVLDAAIWGM